MVDFAIINDSQCKISEFIYKTNKEYINRDTVSFENIAIPDQPPEREDDNREYKLLLEFNDSTRKFEHRSTQMLNRLITGNGKALYLIGLYDDGTISGLELHNLASSVNNVCKIANNIGGIITRISIYNAKNKNTYIAAIRLALQDTIIKDDMFVMI